MSDERKEVLLEDHAQISEQIPISLHKEIPEETKINNENAKEVDKEEPCIDRPHRPISNQEDPKLQYKRKSKLLNEEEFKNLTKEKDKNSSLEKGKSQTANNLESNNKQINQNEEEQKKERAEENKELKNANKITGKSKMKVIAQNLAKKYLTTRESYNVKVISDIIYNENTHIVSVFKDFLIYDDLTEFLKRLYKTSEAIQRLPKIFDYYEKCSKVFPNFVVVEEKKYMFKNISRKQKAINELESQKNKKMLNDSNGEDFHLFSPSVVYKLNQPEPPSILSTSKDIKFNPNDLSLQKLVKQFILEDSQSLLDVNEEIKENKKISQLPAEQKKPNDKKKEEKKQFGIALNNEDINLRKSDLSNAVQILARTARNSKPPAIFADIQSYVIKKRTNSQSRNICPQAKTSKHKDKSPKKAKKTESNPQTGCTTTERSTKVDCSKQIKISRNSQSSTKDKARIKGDKNENSLKKCLDPLNQKKKKARPSSALLSKAVYTSKQLQSQCAPTERCKSSLKKQSPISAVPLSVANQGDIKDDGWKNSPFSLGNQAKKRSNQNEPLIRGHKKSNTPIITTKATRRGKCSGHNGVRSSSQTKAIQHSADPVRNIITGVAQVLNLKLSGTPIKRPASTLGKFCGNDVKNSLEQQPRLIGMDKVKNAKMLKIDMDAFNKKVKNQKEKSEANNSQHVSNSGSKKYKSEYLNSLTAKQQNNCNSQKKLPKTDEKAKPPIGENFGAFFSSSKSVEMAKKKKAKANGKPEEKKKLNLHAS